MTSPLSQAQLGLALVESMVDMTMMAVGADEGPMARHSTHGIMDFAKLMAHTDAGRMLADQGNPVLSPMMQALRR